MCTLCLFTRNAPEHLVGESFGTVQDRTVSQGGHLLTASDGQAGLAGASSSSAVYASTGAPSDVPATTSSYDVLSSLETGWDLDDNVITVYFGESDFTVTFPNMNGGTTQFDSEGFNAYERAQFEKAFDIIESYIDVEFRVVNDRNADFRMALDTDQTEQLGANTLGYFNFPTGSSADGSGLFNGSAWDRDPGGDLEMGGTGFVTIVHEMLHGMGLAHPHDPMGDSTTMPGVTSVFDDYGPYNLNQGIYTTMTYNDGFYAGPTGSEGNGDYGFQAGPMALDIAVLQRHYGANATTNAGNDLYTLDRSNGTGSHWSTIWDTGGNDTIRHTGSAAATIDLRPASLEYNYGGGGWASAVSGVAAGFTIAAGVMIENAVGGSGNDLLVGNDGENLLNGDDGNDTIDGSAGDDTAIYAGVNRSSVEVTELGDGGIRLVSAQGTDDIYNVEFFRFSNGTVSLQELMTPAVSRPESEPGIDVAGSGLAEIVEGSSNDDTLEGRGGNDTIVGFDGNDLIDSGIGFDEVDAGEGWDTIFGQNGYDTIRGGAGYDQIEGNFGNDVLIGGAGNDTLDGGLGFDALRGGNGNDLLVGLDGYDTLKGGGGSDTLKGNAGDDSIAGGDGADMIAGGVANDILFGEAGSDRISGNSGSDLVYGGAGNDTVIGNAGDDSLFGGTGNDRLFGGVGADVFFFAEGDGADLILDMGTVDQVSIERGLTDGQSLQSFATQVDGSLALDFGNGDVLIFQDLTSFAQVGGAIDLYDPMV